MMTGMGLNSNSRSDEIIYVVVFKVFWSVWYGAKDCPWHLHGLQLIPGSGEIIYVRIINVDALTLISVTGNRV